MVNFYTSKKGLWVKVAFILDRFGGDEKELSKASIIDIMSSLFPKQTPSTTSLPSRIRKQINSRIFEEKAYTTKKKTIRLIDETVLDEHSAIMERWEKQRID